MSKRAEPITWLPEHLNDNKIINQLVEPEEPPQRRTRGAGDQDINMRLKARACGWTRRTTTPTS